MTAFHIGRVVVYLDEADADLAQHRWSLNSAGYATRMTTRPRRLTIRLHRIIMRRVLNRELERWELVDHINGDRLDNRRQNLRLATNSQNGFNRDLPAHNKTGYKGVSLNSAGSHRKPYQASITVSGQKYYLGSYADAQVAARAYDEAARRLAGPFARGNFS